MRNKIIYVFLFLPSFLLAQTYVAHYTVGLNSLNREGVLTITPGGTSFYYEKMTENKGSTEHNEDDGSVSQTFFLGGSHTDRKRYQVYKPEQDTLYNINYIGEKRVLNYESFPKMQWTMTSDTKQVSNFLCHKATTTYRGRTYTAWFTTAIPIRLGPWKFNGLPGAILQIYDSSKKFSWTMTSVNTSTDPVAFTFPSDLPKMSLQKFVVKKENARHEKMNRMVLKLAGRGAQIVKSEKHRGREVIFEWEKAPEEG